MSNLPLAGVLGGLFVSALALVESTPRAATGPQDARRAAMAQLGALLDANQDGIVQRYEAAAAAMDLVRRAGGQDQERVTVAALTDHLLKPIAGSPPGSTPASNSVQVDGERLILSGIIDSAGPGRVVEALMTCPEVDEVLLNSTMGAFDADATAQVAGLVGRSGLGVRVPRFSSIDAESALILRAAERRWIDDGARIGVRRGSALPPHMTEQEIDESGLRSEVEALALLDSRTDASLRGLSAVSASVAWATGSGATVLRTVDGGDTWANVGSAALEGLDVRDVAAFDADHAWIMTAGPGEASRIYTTADGGAAWTERYRETAPEAFLDGFDVWDATRGIAYGDPMEDGRFRVVVTHDGGETWAPLATGPAPMEGGEASFAASGTGIRALDGTRAWIATGANDGLARVFMTEDAGATWTASATTIAAQKPAAGAFSVSFDPDGRGVAVGGDFTDRPRGGVQNASWTADFGKTWQAAEIGPRGQRAGSARLLNGHFLATGQTGTDISRDGGKTWRPFSSEGFHCVDVSPTDGAVWFAGHKGRVARLQ